jgi:flagellar hook-associated protein 3 FlgL
MRVVFNSAFDNGLRAVTQAAESLSEAQRQVASGRRIGRPSGDPLGTVTAISEYGTRDRLDAFKATGDAAESRLSVADSVMSDIITQLTSAQTTTLAARGSSPTQAQRTAAANELLAIRDAIMGDVNTRFQGEYLFSGSEVTVPPFAASGSGFTAYQGDSTPSRVEVKDGRTVASGFDGGRIFQGGDPTDVLTVLTDLSAAVLAGDSTGIASGVDALQRAFDRATAAQAEIGNDLKIIENSRLSLSDDRLGVTARLSSIEDADLAKAASSLSQAETAYRAALTSMSTVGKMSLMDYL